MQRRRLQYSVLLIAGFLLSPARQALAQTGNPESGPPVPQEFIERAKDLEAAVMTSDAAVLPKFLDVGALLDRATTGVPASKAFHDGFIRGASGGGGGLTDILLTIRKQGASYRILHVRMKEGGVHAVFRVLMPDGRINYHDWVLEKSPDGQIRIVDGYVAASGEYMSATLRRIYMAAVAQAEPSMIGRILGSDHSFIDHVQDIQSISQNLRDRHPVPALEMYNSLPDSLRNEKVFFLMRITALQQMLSTRRDEYHAALEEYAKLFPGDPSVDLICLDEWVARKDFKAAYSCVDRLEAWTEGDPYLLSLRGALLLQEGKEGAGKKALDLAREATKQESRLLLPRIVALEALAVDKKYDDAVIALQDYEKAARIKLSVEKIPLLKEFADSEAYKKYRNP